MIAIVSVCGANFASVEFALSRLGKKSVLTADSETIKKASHVILPGVGTAHQAMQQLRALNLISTLQELTQPVLGICLGMQILHAFSAEASTQRESGVDCLNIIPGDVLPLPRSDHLIVPHMGWNRVYFTDTASPLLQGIPNGSYMYYVHSYCAGVGPHTLATTHYGEPFSAVVQHKNFYGLQFHPERSGALGALVLDNFINCPN